jgi:3,4-dihydroxy 2-butanone 4-phosphate synthase/GTP cyclohydrolase II
MFNSLPEILESLENGEIICLADDEKLENEIDMMCLAKYATTENINFMIKNARGLVCCPMSAEMCEKIGFEPMKNDNIRADHLGTPFFQSVDLNNGSTGVSAVERGKTARHIASGNARLDDFVSPGHLFTLRAKPDLLKERQGHTEGSVQLAKLCGEEAAIICEIIKENGEMLTLSDFEEWNKDKGLKLYSINELIKHYEQSM